MFILQVLGLVAFIVGAGVMIGIPMGMIGARLLGVPFRWQIREMADMIRYRTFNPWSHR